MTDRPTLGDVSHTHPDHETRDFHWFRRGPAVVTDGGRRESVDDGDDMRNVSHTAPDGDGADRVWDGTRVRESNDE